MMSYEFVMCKQIYHILCTSLVSTAIPILRSGAVTTPNIPPKHISQNLVCPECTSQLSYRVDILHWARQYRSCTVQNFKTIWQLKWLWTNEIWIFDEFQRDVLYYKQQPLHHEKPSDTHSRDRYGVILASTSRQQGLPWTRSDSLYLTLEVLRDFMKSGVGHFVCDEWEWPAKTYSIYVTISVPVKGLAPLD